MPALTYAYGALIGIGGIFGYVGRLDAHFNMSNILDPLSERAKLSFLSP